MVKGNMGRHGQADHGNPAKAWELRLYVAGDTIHSRNAIANLKKICVKHLNNNCHIEVIDLKKRPELAIKDQIVVLPTLIKLSPDMEKRFAGDLSYTNKVLDGLEITGTRNSD